MTLHPAPTCTLACKMQEDSAFNTGDSACNAQLPVLILATHHHTTESVGGVPVDGVPVIGSPGRSRTDDTVVICVLEII